VWLPRQLPVIAPLIRDGWVEVFRGARSVVLAREAGSHIQQHHGSVGGAFPGPSVALCVVRKVRTRVRPPVAS